MRILALVAAFAMILGGAQGVYYGSWSNAPRQITCGEAVAGDPGREWVEVHDCVLALEDSLPVDGARVIGGRPTEMVIPAYPSDPSNPAIVVVVTRNRRVVQAILGMPHGDRAARSAYLSSREGPLLAELLKGIRGTVERDASGRTVLFHEEDPSQQSRTFGIVILVVGLTLLAALEIAALTGWG